MTLVLLVCQGAWATSIRTFDERSVKRVDPRTVDRTTTLRVPPLYTAFIWSGDFTTESRRFIATDGSSSVIPWFK